MAKATKTRLNYSYVKMASHTNPAMRQQQPPIVLISF